jgi:hypothetical protein
VYFLGDVRPFDLDSGLCVRCMSLCPSFVLILVCHWLPEQIGLESITAPSACLYAGVDYGYRLAASPDIPCDFDGYRLFFVVVLIVAGAMVALLAWFLKSLPALAGPSWFHHSASVNANITKSTDPITTPDVPVGSLLLSNVDSIASRAASASASSTLSSINDSLPFSPSSGFDPRATGTGGDERSIRFNRRFGGLYAPYRRETYGYEIVVIISRSLLVLIYVVFLQLSTVRFVMLTIGNSIIFLLHMHHQPYKRSFLNNLATAVLFALCWLTNPTPNYQWVVMSCMFVAAAAYVTVTVRDFFVAFQTSKLGSGLSSAPDGHRDPIRVATSEPKSAVTAGVPMTYVSIPATSSEVDGDSTASMPEADYKQLND